MGKVLDEEVVVKEYSPEYGDKTVEHLINVAGVEHGFREWDNHFISKEFLKISDKEQFWIAVNSKDEVIGAMGLMESEFSENIAKLHSVYVDKDYRSTGVANRLLDKAMNFARECGYYKIVLHTSNAFPAGIKFYEKNGFTVSKTIDTGFGIWYEKNLKDIKWNDYFANIRKKYSMRVSKTKPLIIDLDGKNVTSNIEYSLIDNQQGSFLSIMEQVVKKFTKEYECMAIFGVDEVSFIFNSAAEIIDRINNNKNYKSDEIISIFSQYFFAEFNNLNTHEPIFWHGKCYSIEENKKTSYIKYKSQSILNVFTTYLYYKGERISLDEYLNGNIKKMQEVKKQPKIEFLDLSEYSN